MIGVNKKNEAENSPNFRLILPEQKRLRDAFNEVLRQAGLVFEKTSPRAAQGLTRDLKNRLPDIETYELRADAALEWISDGAANMAVVGTDILREFEAAGKAADRPDQPRPVLSLPRISACSLWIAAKPDLRIENLKDLEGLRIATSYPALLQQLLQQKNICAGRIIAQKGGVESTIPAGRADAILEIVQTGASLDANGLEKKLLAFNSSATLVRSNTAHAPAQEALMEALTQRIKETTTVQRPATTFPARAAL